MPRSVNLVAAKARKKKVLRRVKGFWGARKNVWTIAKNAYDKALLYSYTGRKLKKRDYRSLWIVRINAACRQEGMSYSVFINRLAKANINLNRKALADLAMNNPDAFKAILQKVA